MLLWRDNFKLIFECFLTTRKNIILLSLFFSTWISRIRLRLGSFHQAMHLVLYFYTNFPMILISSESFTLRLNILYQVKSISFITYFKIFTVVSFFNSKYFKQFSQTKELEDVYFLRMALLFYDFQYLVWK